MPAIFHDFRERLVIAIRLAVAVAWVGLLVFIVTGPRSDLLHPADIGSDSSNYAAAGERLIWSDLYRLSPGDRPVSADNPPDWSAPILSPPPVSSVWALMLVVPDHVRFHLFWAIGFASTAVLVLLIVMRLAVVPMLVSMAVLSAGLGIMAWSGNVNALIAPGLAAVWWLTSPDRRRTARVAAGIIVSVAALVKLGPVFVGLWLLAQRERDAVAAAAITGLAGLTVTLWLGGSEPFAGFMDIVRSAVAAPTAISIPGLAGSLGLSADHQGVALIVTLASAATAILVLRRYRAATYSIAIVASVLSTTVVRAETIVVVVVAMTPWIDIRPPTWPPVAHARRAIAATIVTLSMVVGFVSLSTGGGTRSSMTLSNESGSTVVIRFGMPGQFATFGFEVRDGEAGTAWHDRAGSLTGPVYILSGHCRLMDTLSPDPARVVVHVGDRGTRAVTDDAPFMPYVESCAEQLRAQIVEIASGPGGSP